MAYRGGGSKPGGPQSKHLTPGSKPGGTQSTHLIPLTELPEDEARAIRSKGGKARQKQIQQQKRLSEIVRNVLAMGYESGKVANPDTIYTVEDAQTQNVPVQTLIVIREVQKYLEDGNTESRNWLFDHAFPDGEVGGLDTPDSNGTAQTSTPDTGDGVRIHLIRGEKPKPEEESEATPADGAGGAGE